MKGFVLLGLVFMISFVSAACEEGQIDVNSASISELDKIKWVGEATAENIINTRPFGSVDDLINVYGIGEVKLADIKAQGLACVGEDSENEEEPEETPEEVDEIIEKTPDKEKKEIKTITLTTQTIKSPENNENKGRYAIYGFVGFCLVLGVLFALKLRKGKYKNEFG